MKKNITVGTYIFSLLKPVNAYAWTGQTHEDIINCALERLEKEKKLRISAFYKPFSEKLSEGVKCESCSEDAESKKFTHYYNVVNSKNKEFESKEGYYSNPDGEYLRTARTSLEEYYTRALNLYKNGKISEAMVTLGTAAHFLQDLGCPTHTYAVKNRKITQAFAKHANTISKKFSPERFDKRLLKSYSTDSFENAANKLAAASAKHGAAVSELDPIAFDTAVKSLVPLTVQNVTALLIKFYNDVQTSAAGGNYLTDGRLYSFRNEASGLLLTVKKKSVSLEKPDKNLEQKLTLVMSGKGTFAVRISDGGYVSANLKGYDYAKAGSSGAQFGFTALGKNRYRISTEGTDFSKLLTCTRSGGLAVSDFEPENKAQVWILNK